MRHLAAMLVIVMSFVVLPSCQNIKPESEELKQTRYIESMVGKVTSYEKDTGIVIVQTFGSFKDQFGDVFLTRGESGRSANIHLTGQSNKFFRAAEFRSGAVEVGDAVFWRRANPNFREDQKPNLNGSSKPQDQPVNQ